MNIPKISTIACMLLSLSLATTLSAEDGYDGPDRPMLGVVMTPPSTGDLRSNNLENPRGVVIRRVYGGSSAQEMGLRYGDLITEINGVEVNSMGTLRQIIQSYQPGDEVRVEGLRDGEPIENDGFLGGWPENIPFRDIDSNSEARYRDRVANRLARQEQRMARREETLNRLRQEEAELQQEIDDLKNAQQQAAQDDPAQQQATQAIEALNSLMDGSPYAADQLSRLPSMHLHYGLAAGDKDSDPLANDSTHDSESDFSFGFAVSDEML